MPSAVAIILVINITINGQNVEHTERMASLTECWKEARLAMAEAVVIPNDGPERRIVRVGCFAEIEPTPAH